MSLITRGMGETQRLVTRGFGGELSTVTSAVIPDIHGRRSPLYEELAKNLLVDSYSITSMLLQVNGKKMKYEKPNRLLAENDTRDSFRVKSTEKVRVNKTNAKESIFIRVLNVFKRQ